MKTRFTILCVAVSVACTAPALAGDVTFIGNLGACGCEGDWHEPGSWEGGVVPGPADLAVIPAGKQAFVVQNANPVGAINIAAHIDPFDPQKRTFIKIDRGAFTLPIAGSEDSVVDGQLALGVGTLRIDGNLTIKGDGDIYVGSGVISDNGGGEVLTIAPAGVCSPLDRDCVIVLWSDTDGDVQVTLTNDAYVVATASDVAPGTNCDDIVPSLKLTTNTKNGSGFWIAEESGTLLVSAEVKGSGTWIIEDIGTMCTSRIVIDVCCDELTGDVQLSQGEFIVRSGGYFCTTGNTVLKSSPPNGGADVVVYTGRTAAFGNVTCACPL